MSVEIIRGGPAADPHCLHCQLPPVIYDFLKAHPEYGMQGIVDIAMVLGEVIASGLFNSGKRHQLDAVIAIATREMHRSAREMFETLDKRRQ